MKTFYTCPYCKKDRSELEPTLRDKLYKALDKHKIVSEYANPGGRELFFEKEGRIQLMDECCNCDAREILTFLNEE